MSYLNINYSTLEDAWGRNFDKKKRESNVCELYNRRHAGTYKPYKTVMESDFIKPIYTDDNYIKYHGYKDGRPYGRPRHRISKYDVTLPSFMKNDSKYIIDAEEEEIDEEVFDEEYDDAIALNNDIYAKNKYTDNYISPIINPRNRVKHSRHSASKKKPFRHINDVSNVYKETPFSYLDDPHMGKKQYPILVQQEDDDMDEDQMPSKIHPSQACNDAYLYEVGYDSDFDGYFKSTFGSKLPVPESDPESERCENPAINSNNMNTQYEKVMRSAVRENFEQPGATIIPRTRSKDDGRGNKRNSDEKVHLDLALYTISGIILIFIMEQFVQIGLKIKR